jgi:molecular chaperone HtpG
MLFIPAQAPFDLYFREGRRGVQLYVKRVFIMEDCEDLLPENLRFVKGVVDSEDLSLNISREILQQNRQIQRMRKGVVGKVLDALAQMKDKDEAKYRTFWEQFGPVLKEGAFQDHENREKLLDLFLFDSTAGEERTSLRAYVDRMKPDQDAIYYVTGPSRSAAEASPHLEAFREKGYEVLLLTDNVDEVWTQYAPPYDDKPLTSIARGDVELGSEEERKQAEEARKEKQEAHKSLLEALKQPLGDHVKEVRFSARLTESAACIVGDTSDMSPQLEQILRAAGQEAPSVKRILELNPAHPILDKLQGIYDANADDPRIGDYARLLYGQAVLAEGQQPPDPAGFSRLVAKLMVDASG